MREVVWSDPASADYHEALSYISADNPDRADRVSDRIVGAAEALGRIPTGHPGRVDGTYEKSLADVHYILVYELDQPLGTISVVRLIHMSRHWKPGSWPT